MRLCVCCVCMCMCGGGGGGWVGGVSVHVAVCAHMYCTMYTDVCNHVFEDVL